MAGENNFKRWGGIRLQPGETATSKTRAGKGTAMGSVSRVSQRDEWDQRGKQTTCGAGDVAPGQFPEMNNWEARAEFQFEWACISEKGGASKKNCVKPLEIRDRMEAVAGCFSAGYQPGLCLI